jgi:putative membrane protein
MKLIRFLRFLLVAIASGCVLSAIGAATAADAVLSEADRAFVTKAAQGGLMEVAAGKLAIQRGLDPTVKDFGQRMVTDHTAANEQLKSLAQSKQLVLPDSLSEHQNAALGKLEALNGSDFDKTYSRMMVKDHTEDITEFEKEVKKGQDVDVKSLAQSTLPMLRHHLMLASKLHPQHTN